MVSWKGFQQWLRLRKQEQMMTSFAIGMNSSVDITEDKHIVMLDFDLKDQERVEQAVIEAQQFWAMSDCFLFKTTHGFHAIFFHEIVPYSRLRMIIEYTRDVDNLYRYISRFYSHKTLRVAGKYKERDIKFVKIIPGVREPTKQEWELGEMKRAEHRSMIGDAYVLSKFPEVSSKPDNKKKHNANN